MFSVPNFEMKYLAEMPEGIVPDTEVKNITNYVCNDTQRLGSSYPGDVISNYPAYSKVRKQLIIYEEMMKWIEANRPFSFDSLQAKEAIRNLLLPTKLIESNSLIDGDFNLWLKPEHQQITGSFKIRGAAYAISQINRNEFSRVVSVSTGNHAQGIAYAANKYNLASEIFMGEHTSSAKIEAVRNLGASVILRGNSYNEAAANCKSSLQNDSNGYFVHPFDSEDVMTGSSTQMVEAFEEIKSVDHIFISVGGGGQIAKNAAIAHELYGPNVEVIGVQLAGSDSMKRSKEAGRIVLCANPDNFADGVAVAEPSERTLDYVKRFVGRIVTVEKREVAKAMIDLKKYTDAPVEASGALTLAAVRQEQASLKGNVLAFVSGGNLSQESFNHACDMAGFN